MEGEVYLTEADLCRIAAHVGMAAVEFEERYVHRTARHLRLRKPAKGQCIFHRDNRCSIHAVKPVQCRVFPYWPEIIESTETWEETSRFCPGLGKGALVNIQAARQMGQEMLLAYPSMYPSAMYPPEKGA